MNDDKYPLREVVDMKAMHEASKSFARAIRKADKDWRKEKEEGTMYIGASLVVVTAMIVFVILSIKARG